MTNARAPADPYSRKFWDALLGLEEAVDDLSTRILARTAAPAPKTSKRGSSARASRSKDDSDLYVERLRKLQRTVCILRDCLDAPAHQLPAAAQSRNLKRIVHPVVRGNADTAKRARVGRAARRAGMSFHAWVERYGLVDKLPEPQ
jgi:hypothetical protein